MIKGLDRFPTKKEAMKYVQENVYGCAAAKDAEKYLREKIPWESHYQKKIMDALKKRFHDADVWKEAAGAYSRSGRPDVSAVIAGKFFGFEVKRPYFGVISDMQRETIDRIRKAGGYAGIVIFPEDAFKIIEEAMIPKGYADPTANEAIGYVMWEEKQRKRQEGKNHESSTEKKRTKKAERK